MGEVELSDVEKAGAQYFMPKLLKQSSRSSKISNSQADSSAEANNRQQKHLFSNKAAPQKQRRDRDENRSTE